MGTGPSRASLVGQAYEIVTSPAFQLLKPATLVFQYEAGTDPSRLAVYHLEGSTWIRVGGTVDEETNEIKAPAEDFGIYGLFQATASATGSPGISNLEFSNRAFSPGAAALRPQPAPGEPRVRSTNPLVATTDISFDLGSSSTVRIEIYGRSGRLERILVKDALMPPGKHLFTWDGRDHENRFVKSGLYIVVIQADGQKAHKTVAVVNN